MTLHAPTIILAHKARLKLGEALNITDHAVGKMVPYHWKDELPDMLTPTKEEWFRRTCRGLGVLATYDLATGVWTLRRTA